MMTVLLFILIFGVVVISHEFGHFIIAKLNGINVVEFAVGMGPTLLSFKRHGTKYAIKLFPIGGACMFEGEDGLLSELDIEDGSFQKANVWARMATVVAGPFFNFILAFVVAIMIVSIQAPARCDLSGVAQGSPAEAAGLMEGDKIISINGEKTYLFKDISLIAYLNGGNEMEIVYERAGEKQTVMITPTYNEEYGSYMLGIYGTGVGKAKGLSVFSDAFYEMRYSAVNTYKSLKMLVTGKLDRKEVAGPVGIANVVGETYDVAKEYGVLSVFYSMAQIVLLLSVNLGILNLLPVPALDGGRLVFMIVEVFRGKPIPPEKEGIVHLAGLVFFMVLMVVVLFNDIINIFG